MTWGPVTRLILTNKLGRKQATHSFYYLGCGKTEAQRSLVNFKI